MKTKSILAVLAVVYSIGSCGLCAHAEEAASPTMTTTTTEAITTTTTIQEAAPDWLFTTTAAPADTEIQTTTTLGMAASPGNAPDGELNKEPANGSAVESGQAGSSSSETQTAVSGKAENNSPKTGVSGLSVLAFGAAASLAAMITFRKKK